MFAYFFLFFHLLTLRIIIIQFSVCVELQTTRFAIPIAVCSLQREWEREREGARRKESSDCDDVWLLWCALLIDWRVRENTWHKFRCNFSDLNLYKYNCLCTSVLSLALNLNVRFFFNFFLSLTHFFTVFNTLDLICKAKREHGRKE